MSSGSPFSSVITSEDATFEGGYPFGDEGKGYECSPCKLVNVSGAENGAMLRISWSGSTPLAVWAGELGSYNPPSVAAIASPVSLNSSEPRRAASTRSLRPGSKQGSHADRTCRIYVDRHTPLSGLLSRWRCRLQARHLALRLDQPLARGRLTTCASPRTDVRYAARSSCSFRPLSASVMRSRTAGRGQSRWPASS